MPNKATREIRDIAQSYGEKAIREAARLMTKAETEPARISAINIILDRAYGKPAQSVSHSGAVGTFDLSKATDEDLAVLEPILARLTLVGSGQGGDRET